MGTAQKKKVDKRNALEKANDFDFEAHENRVGEQVLEQNQKAHHDRLAEMGVDKVPLVRLQNKAGNVLEINSTALDDIAAWKKQGYVEAPDAPKPEAPKPEAPKAVSSQKR